MASSSLVRASAPKPAVSGGPDFFAVPPIANASYAPRSSAYKPAGAIGPASINDVLLNFYGEDPENAIKVGAARLSDLKFSEAGYLEGKHHCWMKSDPNAQVPNFKLAIKSDKQRILRIQTPCFVPQSLQKAWGLGNWIPLDKRPTDVKSQEWTKYLPKNKGDSHFDVNISMHPYCEAAQVKDGPFEGLNVHMVKFVEQLVLLTVDGIKRLMYEHPAMFAWLPDWRKSTKLKRAEIEAMPALQFFELVRPFINFKLTKKNADGDVPVHAQKEGAREEEEEEEVAGDTEPFDYADFVRRLIFTFKSRCFFDKKADDARLPYPNPKYAEIEALENCIYSPFPVAYVVQDKNGKFGVQQLTPEQRCNPQFFVKDTVCRVIGAVSISPNNNKGKTKVGMTISELVFICKSDIPLAAGELKIAESDEAAEFNRRIREKAEAHRRKAAEDASTNQIAEEEQEEKPETLTTSAKRKAEEEEEARMERIQEALEASNNMGFDEEVVDVPVKHRKFDIPRTYEDDD